MVSKAEARKGTVMEMTKNLAEKVARIESLIDVGPIVTGDHNSPKTIRTYYRINHFAYKLFHSDRGFMHFRVTKGEKPAPEDIFYQPDVISTYIASGARVVELGPGQGANIVYLANKNPEAEFIGLDLKPPKLRRKPANVTLYKQNYEDMAQIEDGTADVVFGIETVVHCSNKEKVFSEAYRVLKPGGVLIVYDYSLKKEFEEYDRTVQTAIDLISKCGASARIESDRAWNGHYAACGFEMVSNNDLGTEIMPDLYRLYKTARRIIDHRGRTKFVFRLFPDLFVNNIVIGYLGYDFYKEGNAFYREWIWKKKG